MILNALLLLNKKNLFTMLEGWTHPTLRHVENQWRIYSNSGVAFVPLETASPALVAACQGAWEKLEELDNEPF